MKTFCHRTGFGFDSHAYGERGTLVLGGIPFPNMPALRGHSDGDAVLHAVIDALLGAASLGDIGEVFPDSDPKLKGVSSLKLLGIVLKSVKHAGFDISFLDVTIVADKPRIAPSKPRLRKAIAGALELPVEGVSVKAKTQEGLSWFGSHSGVAVWAVATLTQASRSKKK